MSQLLCPSIWYSLSTVSFPAWPAGGVISRKREVREDACVLQKNESVRYDYVVDRDIMQHFGETFDDFTLLHYDDEYARKVGFERSPVQGALVSAIIVKSIVRAFGDSAILRVHNLEFFKPIYPGSNITVELHVLTNIRNRLVTLRSRVYLGETLHYEGMTKIRTFEYI
jgi:acyl dehydratase